MNPRDGEGLSIYLDLLPAGFRRATLRPERTRSPFDRSEFSGRQFVERENPHGAPLCQKIDDAGRAHARSAQVFRPRRRGNTYNGPLRHQVANQRRNAFGKIAGRPAQRDQDVRVKDDLPRRALLSTRSEDSPARPTHSRASPGVAAALRPGGSRPVFQMTEP